MYLRKLFGNLFLPLPLSVSLMVAGLLLLWFSRKQKLARMVVSTGVLFLAVVTCLPLSDVFLSELEQRYKPLTTSQLTDPDVSPKLVVVLGGGYTADPNLPALSQLSSSSLTRLVEGIRLHRQLPGSKLILSGGATSQTVSVAEVMSNAAQSLGVNPQEVLLEAESKNTEEEARLIAPMVGPDQFVLVTSASHMPRSMALFRKQGMSPIAAPTDYGVKHGDGNPIAFGLLPRSQRLDHVDKATHEYLGLIWAWLQGRI